MRGHLTLLLGGSRSVPRESGTLLATLLAISIVFNAKHAGGIDPTRLVTFGTSLALLKCVTAVETQTDFKRKEQPNES
jgi:hypothetical protein